MLLPRLQPLCRRFDRLCILVDTDQPAGPKARCNEAGMSCPALCAVHIDAVRFDCKSFIWLLQQDGCMFNVQRLFLS